MKAVHKNIIFCHSLYCTHPFCPFSFCFLFSVLLGGSKNYSHIKYFADKIFALKLFLYPLKGGTMIYILLNKTDVFTPV